MTRESGHWMRTRRWCLALALTFAFTIASGCASDAPTTVSQPVPGAPSPTPTATVVSPVAPSVTPAAPDAPEAPKAREAADIDTDAFPVVLDVTASTDDGSSWRFSVTLSSPYDTPQRYADAWRVLDPNDAELGIRVLGHDHANEQPFTRSQSGIAIPDDATVVYVEGRDQANGWSGQRFAFDVRR